MPRNYKAKTSIIGLLYDTKMLVEHGKIQDAFKLLKQKVEQIDKAMNNGYQKVVWDE